MTAITGHFNETFLRRKTKHLRKATIQILINVTTTPHDTGMDDDTNRLFVLTPLDMVILGISYTLFIFFLGILVGTVSSYYTSF